MGKDTPNPFLVQFQALDHTLGKLLEEPSATGQWTDLENAQNHVRDMILKPSQNTLKQLDISLTILKQSYPDLSEHHNAICRISKEFPEYPTANLRLSKE